MSAQQVPPRAARLFSLWQRLPDGPFTEVQLEQSLLQLLDRPGAQADASAYSTLLVGAEAVVPVMGEDGVTRLRKAEKFPEWPQPAGPGTEAYDQTTRELAAEQERQFDRDAAQAFKDSPQNQQRLALVVLIDERIDRRIRELKRSADGAAITRARELMQQDRPA